MQLLVFFTVGSKSGKVGFARVVEGDAKFEDVIDLAAKCSGLRTPKNVAVVECRPATEAELVRFLALAP